MNTQQPAAWPRIEAVINIDGTGQVTVGGATRPVKAADLTEARDQVRQLAAQTANTLGRPVRAVMVDPDGEWPLIVNTDGTLEPDSTIEPRPASSLPSTQPVNGSGIADRMNGDTGPSTLEPSPTPTEPSPGPTPPPRPAPAPTSASAAGQFRHRLETRTQRRSFLTEEQREEPATKGWRGLLARVGVRVDPSEAERAERADIQAVSQHWPGPRTIAVVNAKGGAGKTPTTVLLSAVFARYGGAGVLAWDNNQTRGTLGWRTEQGPHQATLLDLLPEVDRLLGTGAQSADLAHYVHHQTRDRYDVLRSKPDVLASEQRVTAADVDAIHAVAAKYYRLIFIDSGNDETDPMWLRMIDHTDQLVVATTTRDDHAEAGALLLEALADRDERSAQLAEAAVVIVTQADPKAAAGELQRVAHGYRDLARDVATIPYDPAMVDGVLRYGSLRPGTQRAWLAAAAAVARGL